MLDAIRLTCKVVSLLILFLSGHQNFSMILLFSIFYFRIILAKSLPKSMIQDPVQESVFTLSSNLEVKKKSPWRSWSHEAFIHPSIKVSFY
jgi:hypothetical protein